MGKNHALALPGKMLLGKFELGKKLPRQSLTRQNVETVESPGHIFLWDLREGLWMNLSGKIRFFKIHEKI